ncbi:hypothetical protein [Virgibacillus sp. SK37]|uniref:hypothetical protein n=1 Tax=Virgibacillus sp. SK37 TaxID=403957 RepID=UPI0004D18DD9|nr:hypothetical protein [Virgibacillus sp. SK37]AIF45531.1 hypothetical protein X953_15870 [Virgibacillus sp. SK37]
MAAFTDHDNHMEVDRMINEGLGGGFISNDYDVRRFEVYPQPTPIPNSSPQLHDSAQIVLVSDVELMESL